MFFKCLIEKFTEMRTYKVERSDILYNLDGKSMVCTFTITHIKTREKYVFNNVYLAEDNKEAFLIFPSTNEKVYINSENEKELLLYRVQVKNKLKN